MIHRAFLGSIERFIAILIENTNGNLPIWLLKIQLVIIPIKKKNYKYSKNIFFYLIKKGIKCIIDNNKYDLNKKIKKYEKNKIPFIFIIGDNEEKKKKISMRINNKIKILKKEKALSYVLKKNINI
ncbi:MAG: His/Gly/Thr/Pro-type tRNA ligase C-terminal domain-containing protein [Candidatus Shikimatogenerans bostrichidophilus]|nr:MAG: His/Gly/Thr/Pro-type tRNA ligase C-terminal domain-containing protein [Candidatus Shikimatogenerans bostrichidophilus]